MAAPVHEERDHAETPRLRAVDILVYTSASTRWRGSSTRCPRC